MALFSNEISVDEDRVNLVEETEKRTRQIIKDSQNCHNHIFG